MAGAAAVALSGRAGRAADRSVVRIGVLTDLSGPYADNTGAGSVLGVQMAAEDAKAAFPGLQVDVISADLQNRADIGILQARTWFDQQDVHAIVDVPNSAVALGVASLARDKNRVALFSGAASSELTGRACGPNHIQWTQDTYSIPSTVAKAVVTEGGTSWFFITPNYAFGAAMESDTRRFVEQAGGRVVGSVRYPFPETTDFSSFLLQAQSSGAKVVGLTMSGQDAANCVRQAEEFGIGQKSGQTLAGLAIQNTTVRSIGLQDAQGMLLAESFYWDLNDGTRAFSARFAPRNRDAVPTTNQAGCYAAALHYLKSVHALGTEKAAMDGAATIAAMEAMPTDDPLFGRGTIRPDGRKIHDIHLFRVKPPARSKGPWDLYDYVSTVPGVRAFRPLAEGGCIMPAPTP